MEVVKKSYNCIFMGKRKIHNHIIKASSIQGARQIADKKYGDCAVGELFIYNPSELNKPLRVEDALRRVPYYAG